MKKIISILCVILVLITLFSFGVSANTLQPTLEGKAPYANPNELTYHDRDTFLEYAYDLGYDETDVDLSGTYWYFPINWFCEAQQFESSGDFVFTYYKPDGVTRVQTWEAHYLSIGYTQEFDGYYDDRICFKMDDDVTGEETNRYVDLGIDTAFVLFIRNIDEYDTGLWDFLVNGVYLPFAKENDDGSIDYAYPFAPSYIIYPVNRYYSYYRGLDASFQWGLFPYWDGQQFASSTTYMEFVTVADNLRYSRFEFNYGLTGYYNVRYGNFIGGNFYYEDYYIDNKSHNYQGWLRGGNYILVESIPCNPSWYIFTYYGALVMTEFGEVDQAYWQGYQSGYTAGVDVGESNQYFDNILGDTLKAPINAMDSLYLYNHDGVTISLWGVLTAVIGLGLFIWFLKIFAGG